MSLSTMKTGERCSTIKGRVRWSLVSLCLLCSFIHVGSLEAQNWARTYGGGENDEAVAVRQTPDGGFIVAGNSESFGAGESDFWLMKLGVSGDIQWQKVYGNITANRLVDMDVTADGGYVLIGSDFWVIRLEATGDIIWQRLYGGTGHLEASAIEQADDGGFIAVGRTNAYGAGGYDMLALKLSGAGVIECERTYGFGDDEGANDVDSLPSGELPETAPPQEAADGWAKPPGARRAAVGGRAVGTAANAVASSTSARGHQHLCRRCGPREFRGGRWNRFLFGN